MMRRKLRIILLLIVIGIVFINCKGKSSNDKFSFDKIYYYAIQEDVLKIVKSLNSISDDSLSADQREIKEKYISRFQAKTEKFDFKTQDSLIINILTIFHDYWIDVLMKQHSIRESENKARLSMLNIVNDYTQVNGGITGYKINGNDIPLGYLLKHYGYYSRIERTGNIMDAIIWIKQSKEIYSVNINDTIVNVPVVFIDSIVTLGWEEYATLGNFRPGGWAGSDTLYCVKKDYDLNSEKFKVRYLAHETQHLLDHKIYSEVSGWMAEYRAKLAELSVSKKSIYDLIDGFIKGSKNDSRLTHPYAEYRAIGDLSKEIFGETFVTDTLKWGKISYQEINKVSRKILKQSSIDLKKK